MRTKRAHAMNRNGAVKRAGSRSVRGDSPPSRTENPIELPDGLWERIRIKAYELYQQRVEGRALQDWLDAEDIVREEMHEARE